MKRANRPVPILVPQQEDTRSSSSASGAARDAPDRSSFNLSDSGVWSEGGVVFSTAGCIIRDVTTSSSSSKPGAGGKQAGGGAGGGGGGGACNSGHASAALPPAAAGQPSAGPAQPAAKRSPGASNAAGAEHTQGRGAEQQQHASSNSSSQPAVAATAGVVGASDSIPGDVSTASCSAIALADLQELCVIGSGSSGVVKKVLHTPTNQVYVLKVLRNIDLGSRDVRRQVTREVRALHGARHPHVVSYHDSFFADGTVTILMEHMDGGTLWDLLQKIRVVPERHLAELTRQVLEGLAFLHDAARICHRDVKPSNLLLSSGGQLKISDFGTSSQLSNSMSRCLSWVGTVTYMSPERIRGDSYTFNTDVWSLGLLVLECAQGRYPYPPQQQQGEGPGAAAAAAAATLVPAQLGFWELLEYIVVEPVPRLPLGPFSPELVDFVGQCLQKDPARRPSAAQLLTHPFITQQAGTDGRANLAELLRLPPVRPAHSGGAGLAPGGAGAGLAALQGGGVCRSGSYGSGLRRSWGHGGGMNALRRSRNSSSLSDAGGAAAASVRLSRSSLSDAGAAAAGPSAAPSRQGIGVRPAGAVSVLAGSSSSSSSAGVAAPQPTAGQPADAVTSSSAAAAAAGTGGSSILAGAAGNGAGSGCASVAAPAAAAVGPSAAVAAAAAAALCQSSPLLSGKLRQSMAVSLAPKPAADGRTQQQRQAMTHQPLRASLQQLPRHAPQQPQQQTWLSSLQRSYHAGPPLHKQQQQQLAHAGPLCQQKQQQQQALHGAALQQMQGPLQAQQRASQQQHEQLPQGPLALQLASMQLQQQHQGRGSSPCSSQQQTPLKQSPDAAPGSGNSSSSGGGGGKQMLTPPRQHGPAAASSMCGAGGFRTPPRPQADVAAAAAAARTDSPLTSSRPASFSARTGPAGSRLTDSPRS